MTKYAVISSEGKVYELPKYTIDVASKFEAVESYNAGNYPIRDKCKRMYDLETSILGADAVNEIIGAFKDADPNEINILYLKMVEEYNKPLIEFNNNMASEKLQEANLDKVIELVNAYKDSGINK